MDWLHFIGKAYYTIPGFEHEAKLLGVSRKVSIRILSAFSWGDRIWIARGDMKTKNRTEPLVGSVVLGYFRLECLSGLKPSFIKNIEDDLALVSLGSSREIIERGCGSYQTGPQYQTRIPLTRISKILQRFDQCDFGDLLLQGSYFPLSPKLLMRDVTFRLGFRQFHSQECLNAAHRSSEIIEYQGMKIPAVSGEFRDVESLTKSVFTATPILGTVRFYLQAKMYSTLKDQKRDVAEGETL